jgi:hypothetical protein
MVKVLCRSQCLFSEVYLIPLLETHIYILLIWDGPLGLVFHPQHIPTLVLHIEDIPFCNTFSFEGMIFVSLRHTSKSLEGIFLSLIHFHTPNFYGNSPTWFYKCLTSPYRPAGHNILGGVC